MTKWNTQFFDVQNIQINTDSVIFKTEIILEADKVIS